MRYSWLHVFGFLLIVGGTTMLIISLATYHWSIQELKPGTDILWLTHRGLFSQCTELRAGAEIPHLQLKVGEIKCKNRLSTALFGDDSPFRFMEEFRTWEIVAISLMTASVIISLISVIFAQCCCDYIGFVQVFWLALGSISTFGAVICFAENMKAEAVPADSATGAVSYDWSFWLAIGAGIVQFASAAVFAAARLRFRRLEEGFRPVSTV